MSKQKRPANQSLDKWLEIKNDEKKKCNEDGKWSDVRGELLIYTPNVMINRLKIAGFDLDGTLITTASGKVFPTNESDWKLIYPCVSTKMEELFNDEYKIVIFSNQKGLMNGKLNANVLKRKIESICQALSVPIQVFISTGTLNFRKPYIGMWEYLEEYCNDEVSINRSDSFYVGDAAGRLASKERKKDHSAGDRLFAYNLGIKFFTPEQFFLNRNTGNEPSISPAFNPLNFLSTKRTLFESANVEMPSGRQEIIVLVGFPGCGKSFFANKLVNLYGYACVNRDTLKTWQKCVENANVHLRKGKSVVVDNTNSDTKSRKRYCDLAKEHGVDCRCFIFNCDINQAYHMCKYRIISCTDRSHNDIGMMVLRMYKSKYEEPKLDEGYSAIINVNFVPEFNSEKEKKIFQMYLCDN